MYEHREELGIDIGIKQGKRYHGHGYKMKQIKKG